ncbi:MAG: PTS fructose transporter subunit IIA [Burkholderiales bacterium]|jgi:mannose PTS system EIIA component|nr:PTS fructose transporter subunit IIA [Burkholderiales bacterium]
MVGILIVAHGTLGESLIHCASHVMGTRPPQLMQIGVTVHDDPAQILPQALRLVKQLDHGNGVLVLTDVYGATPGNIAARLLIPNRVEGVAGVNLPMLVRALTYRNEPLKTVVAKAMSGGVEGVFRMPPAIENAATGS